MVIFDMGLSREWQPNDREPVLGQCVPVAPGGVVRPAIGVMHAAGWRPSLVNGGAQRRQRLPRVEAEKKTRAPCVFFT